MIRLFLGVVLVVGGGQRACAQQAPVRMPIDAWATFDGAIEDSRPRGEAAPMRMRVAPDGVEDITVTGQSHKLDRDWQLDVRRDGPGYEASNSDSAQPMYSPFPVYTSADQQRMMSGAKDALGVCGALGGWVNCPNR